MARIAGERAGNLTTTKVHENDNETNSCCSPRHSPVVRIARAFNATFGVHSESPDCHMYGVNAVQDEDVVVIRVASVSKTLRPLLRGCFNGRSGICQCRLDRQ
ncbi:hypothetical protein BCAR13_1560009 [Paraburkholderia caribensis]|nr:hypothetical protein BCAR13_1560009 [Paraburkholderia caribensis]